MGMEVNGQSILASIARSPSAFAMGEPQINALAMTTLLARFKDKSVDIVAIRSIALAIGQHDFSLTLDHLADKDVAALVKRLDPKNAQAKTANAAWHREQINKLAHGSADPMAAMPKAAKSVASQSPSRAKKPKTGDVMESKALKPRTPRKIIAKEE